MVGVDRERPSVTALPGLLQRVGHQRQSAGLAGDVPQHEVDQAGLDPETGEPGRFGDRAMQVVVLHRDEQHLVAGDRAGELGIGAHLPVEVGPDADHHGTAAGEKGTDELLSAIGVVALGVELLELIDDQEIVRAVAEVERWLGPGRDQPSRAGDGKLARLYGGKHAGPEQRGLAASRCADDRQQPARRDARQQVGHHLLATEEEAAIARLEGEQAAIGAFGGRRRRRAGRGLQAP